MWLNHYLVHQPLFLSDYSQCGAVDPSLRCSNGTGGAVKYKKETKDEKKENAICSAGLEQKGVFKSPVKQHLTD